MTELSPRNPSEMQTEGEDVRGDSAALSAASAVAAEAKEFEQDRFPGRAVVNQANLGLVLDVELNVLLRFGRRQLTLREVLDLKCGSVVELDRRVDEPVELLLDGRVIARGDAAIVDGNYGLRVTEIVHPSAPRASD